MKRILMLSILLLSACASVKSDVGTVDSDAATKMLITYAQTLVGIPYKYGGISPDSGFDCSGFVRHVFQHTLGINLPRSSDEISHVGQAISKGNLRVGDLVFFNTLQRKFSHVGIYLGNEHFIHAPSNRTGRVRTEDMREAYWTRQYNGARRITLSG
jgi:cell wall-associated NlpC family hydrolase